MDFNPLMLLAGNLTSIIQSSGEEGLRKTQKREGGKDRKSEGKKRGGGGEGERKKAQMYLLTASRLPLSPPLAPFKSH